MYEVKPEQVDQLLLLRVRARQGQWSSQGDLWFIFRHADTELHSRGNRLVSRVVRSRMIRL
jgi:hypothetical protein